jgi:RNA polymerase subunit RPABC4/transcription elongation factor Spt4
MMNLTEKALPPDEGMRFKGLEEYHVREVSRAASFRCLMMPNICIMVIQRRTGVSMGSGKDGAKTVCGVVVLIGLVMSGIGWFLSGIKEPHNFLGYYYETYTYGGVAIILILCGIVLALGGGFVYRRMQRKQYFLKGKKLCNPEKLEEAEKLISDLSQKKCPRCQNILDSSWKACPVCGKDLPHLCSKCGAELEVDWVSCPFCS